MKPDIERVDLDGDGDQDVILSVQYGGKGVYTFVYENRIPQKDYKK